MANEETEECDELSSIIPLVLIFLSQFVLGIGNTIYYSLGQSYLDDNTKKTNTPIMFAYALSLRMFGPVIGFALGYFSLSIFIDPTKTPLISDKDQRWLGAWWLGWLIIGFSVLLFAILIGMFPKEMIKNRKKIERRLSDIPKVLLAEEMQKNSTSAECERRESLISTAAPNIKDFPSALLRLLKNKLLMFNIWAAVFYILGSAGYITFISKYMEVQFNKSSADAAVVTGPLSIIGLVIGFLSSGYVISKYKPTLRTLFLWNIFVGIFCIMSETSYLFFSCENGNLLTETGKLNLTNSCNMKCSCDAVPYSPVCHELTGVTYFSPCHAGCVEYVEDEKYYRNCSCSLSYQTTSSWLDNYFPPTKYSTENQSTEQFTTVSPNKLSTTAATKEISKTTEFLSSSTTTTTTNEPNLDTTDETEIILQTDTTTEQNQLETMYDLFSEPIATTVAWITKTDKTDSSTTSSSITKMNDNDEKILRRKREINDNSDDMLLIPGVCMAGCDFIFYTFTVVSIFINMLGGTARISNILLNFRYYKKMFITSFKLYNFSFFFLFLLFPIQSCFQDRQIICTRTCININQFICIDTGTNFIWLYN